MNVSKSKTLYSATLLATAVLALSGCTINIGGTPMAGVDPHAGHMLNQGQSQPDSTSFSQMDIMFAQMMIPHHEQAVQMSALAPTRAESDAVRELAAEIMGEQDPEIERMKNWLISSGASLEMGHEMDMGGMLTDEQLLELENSTGAEFDRLFLEGMILHHEGAIQMAQMVISSQNAEARQLGEAIVESQTKQIELMRSMLEG